jgi:hypothetical protein
MQPLTSKSAAHQQIDPGKGAARRKHATNISIVGTTKHDKAMIASAAFWSIIDSRNCYW